MNVFLFVGIFNAYIRTRVFCGNKGINVSRNVTKNFPTFLHLVGKMCIFAPDFAVFVEKKAQKNAEHGGGGFGGGKN